LPTSKHGGKRANAGRKQIAGEPMTRVNVMLDARTIEAAKKIGGGNLSQGLREAARKAAA